MRRIQEIITALILLSSVGSQPGLGRAATPPDSTIVQTLARYLETQSELGHLNGSVLIAREGEILHSRGYGKADFQSEIQNSPGTKYRAASLSKSFTAMAILILVDRGQLRIDDTIGSYLNEIPEAWSGATVRQLLSHTAGIPDYEAAFEIGSDRYNRLMSQPASASKILDSMRATLLTFPSGADFEYSNTGYIILSMLVENVADEPFDQFLDKNIFTPLGMTATGHHGGGKIHTDHAIGYVYVNGYDRAKYHRGLRLESEMQVGPNLRTDPPHGDAGIYSTTLDLLKWDNALYSGGLVSESLLADMFDPGKQGYGFGWIVDTDRAGRQRVHHNGFLPGWNAEFRRYPESRTTIILLGNTDLMLNRIADDLGALIFGEPINWPESMIFVEIDSASFAGHCGDYVDEHGDTLKVRHTEDGAEIQMSNAFMALMFPLDDGTYFAPMFNGKVAFETKDGSSVGVSVMRRGVPWTFKRAAN